MADSRELTQARLFVQRTQTRLEDFTRRMVTGDLEIRAWAVEMEKELRTLHLGVAVIAFGENRRLSAEAEAVARRMTDSEIGFLRRWRDELLRDGVAEAMLPRLLQRARQYALAGLETFERAIARLQGLPDMPFFPKQNTICHRGCKCRWRFVQLEGRGNYDCFWTLAPAEHCITCLARRNAARPLQVRNGVIQNPERFTDPVLHGATASVIG